MCFKKKRLFQWIHIFAYLQEPEKNNQNNLLRTAWYTGNISISLYASLKYVTQIHNTHTVPCFWQLIRKLLLVSD